MSDERTFGVCDTCGDPATSIAVDAIRCEPPGSQWVEYRPLTGRKRGCDRHPARPLKYDSGGNLIGRADDNGRPIPEV
jgi:hypothetical protein